MHFFYINVYVGVGKRVLTNVFGNLFYILYEARRGDPDKMSRATSSNMGLG